MEDKLRNLTFIVIFGFIILAILIIGLYFKDGGSTTSSNNSSGSGSSSSTQEYDVSAMNEVDVDEALALFDEEGTHVLYIGRSGCTYCRQFVPVLNEVQEDLGFTTNYLNAQTFMNDWSGSQDELKPLTDKMTVEASANGETGTLGELFLANGFTPALVVIKDGKAVAGFFGYRDADTLTTLLKQYL